MLTVPTQEWIYPAGHDPVLITWPADNINLDKVIKAYRRVARTLATRKELCWQMDNHPAHVWDGVPPGGEPDDLGDWFCHGGSERWGKGR